MYLGRIVTSFILFTAPSLTAASPSFECGTVNSSQVEIGACVSQQLDIVNQTLDAALKIATESAAELDQITERESSAPALTSAQSAWEEYRAAHCNFVGTTYGGGSGAGIAMTSCQIDLGRGRIQELVNYSQ